MLRYLKQCNEERTPAFQLGAYTDLSINASPLPKALVQCAPLLKCILQEVPGAIVNHCTLASALKRVDEECKVRPSGVTAEEWSRHLAFQIRVALAHLRKLKNVPRLLQQRSKGLPGPCLAILGGLLDLYQPLSPQGTGGSGESMQSNGIPESPPPREEGSPEKTAVTVTSRGTRVACPHHCHCLVSLVRGAMASPGHCPQWRLDAW